MNSFPSPFEGAVAPCAPRPSSRAARFAGTAFGRAPAIALLTAALVAAAAVVPAEAQDGASHAGVHVKRPPFPFPNAGGSGDVVVGGGTPERPALPGDSVGPVVPQVWFPFPLPGDAGTFGVAPGYYAEWYGSKSTAVVNVIRPPQASDAPKQVLSYSSTITAAVIDLRAVPRAAEFTEEGTRRFRARDYAGAADLYRRAVPLDPDNGLPRFALGHALFALGDYEDAAYVLRRGLALLPDFAASGNCLALLWGDTRDLEDQKVALRAHRRIHPADEDARFVDGYVAFFSGELERAREALAPLAEPAPAVLEAPAAEPSAPRGDAATARLLAEIDRIRANGK